jgi:hypothetical protein
MRRGAAPRHAPRRRGAAGRRARARAAAKYARGSEVCRKYVLCACRAVSATAARHDSLAAGAGRAPGRRQEAELFAPRIQLVTRCMAGAGALQHAGHSPALCRSSACCLPRRVCCQVGHLLSRTTIHPVASPSCESRTATSARCHRRLAEQRAEARDAAALARLARIKGEAAATGRARMLLKGAQPAIQITLGRDEDPDSPARRPPAPRRAHSCHHLRPASRSRSSLAMASKPSASVCICSVRPCRLRSRSPRCSRRERVSSRPAPSASALRAAARQAPGTLSGRACSLAAAALSAAPRGSRLSRGRAARRARLRVVARPYAALISSAVRTPGRPPPAAVLRPPNSCARDISPRPTVIAPRPRASRCGAAMSRSSLARRPAGARGQGQGRVPRTGAAQAGTDEAARCSEHARRCSARSAAHAQGSHDADGRAVERPAGILAGRAPWGLARRAGSSVCGRSAGSSSSSSSPPAAAGSSARWPPQPPAPTPQPPRPSALVMHRRHWSEPAALACTMQAVTEGG